MQNINMDNWSQKLPYFIYPLLCRKIFPTQMIIAYAIIKFRQTERIGWYDFAWNLIDHYDHAEYGYCDWKFTDLTC